MRTILQLRTAAALAVTAWTPAAFAHWPGQPPHQMAELGDLQLESGAVIANFRMSYVTHGTPNAAQHNAILFQHGPREASVARLQEGTVDAYMGFPPEPQDLRALKIGHVIVNSATDRPWSQYFCYVVGANRQFVREHPVATKRALRAFMKATAVVEKGWTDRKDYARQTIRDLPYSRWREFNPEDTIRFYALRLLEAGMVKASPRKILAQDTDWRFLNELKKELKA